MEITPEVVLARLRGDGGHLRVEDLDDHEVAAWRQASKVLQLRLLRAGHERLIRQYDRAGKLDLWLSRTDRRNVKSPSADARKPPPPVLPRTAEFTGRKIPVPSKITKPDPLLAELEQAIDWPEELFRRRWGKWRQPARVTQ